MALLNMEDTRITSIKSMPFALALSVLLCAGTGTASAAPKKPNGKTLELSYDIYGQGFKLMTLKFDLKLAGQKYQMSSKLKTTGMADFFSKMSAKYQATGQLARKGIKPNHFSMSFQKKKKKQTAKISWNKNGRPKIEQTPRLKTERRAEIKKNLRSGLPDPLSSMLALSIVQANTPCKFTQRVIDGRKIFDLKFTYSKAVQVTERDTGIYRGTAHRCSVKTIPVAGYSKKKLAKMAASPIKPFTVWFAPIKNNALGRDMLVPLIISGSTDWAEITVRLTKARIDGRSLKAMSFASN